MQAALSGEKEKCHYPLIPFTKKGKKERKLKDSSTGLCIDANH